MTPVNGIKFNHVTYPRSLSNSPDLPTSSQSEKAPTAVIGWTCVNGQAVQKPNVPTKKTSIYPSYPKSKIEFQETPNIQVNNSVQRKTNEKCRLYPELCEKLKKKGSTETIRTNSFKTIGSYNKMKYSKILKTRLKTKSLAALCEDLVEEEEEDRVLLPSISLVSTSDEDEKSIKFSKFDQNHQNIFYPSQLSDDEDDNADSGIDQLLYHRRANRILSQTASLRRQVFEQYRSIKQNVKLEGRLKKRLKCLTTAAKTSANTTSDILRLFDIPVHRTVEAKRRKRTSIGGKEPCAFQKTAKCTKDALPFTKHCLEHITYNVNQQLFNFCTAKCANQTPCRAPVFDIVNNMALCPKHSSNSSQQTSNPFKKIRRKTKPSALTRPQRKKKKKTTTQKSDRTVTNTINSQSKHNNNSIPSNAHVVEENTKEKDAVIFTDIDEAIQQATALLEEQDFNFVLNGLKDDDGFADFQDIEKSFSENELKKLSLNFTPNESND